MPRVNFQPKRLVALLLLWGMACVGTFFFARFDIVFLFAYFVLPVSAFIVPLVVGYLGAQMYCFSSTSEASRPSAKPQFIALIFLTGISYLLCMVVLARMLEIPWRQAKFGDPVLSLGRSAAQFFVFTSIAVATATTVILRTVSRNTTAARFGVAALAMLAAACLAYLVVGLSPMAVWRA